MAGTDHSNKDMQVISDGILTGVGSMEQLPSNVQAKLAEYWQSQGIDMSNPNSDLTQAQLGELAQQRAAAEGGGTPWLLKPIEWVGSKLYKFYSATVSPILSAGTMSLHSVIYGRPDYIGEDGEWDAFKDYWNLAHKVSPGQAVWMLGMNDDELKARGIRPDQIARDKDLVLKGDYRDKPTTNDPFGARIASEEYFSSGAAKYVSGATDLAVSWYLDPLVLGGKAAGAAKVATFTKPTAPLVQKAAKIAEKKGPGPEGTFDVLSQQSSFQSMVNQVMKIKTANPENAALRLRRDMPTLAKSANGDVLARLLTNAKDADEVTDVLRISIGDVAAKDALEVRNATLKMQIDGATQKQSLLGSYYDNLDDTAKLTSHGQRVKQLLDNETKIIAKADAQSRIVSDKIDSFASLDNLNYNRVTTPLGMKVKGSKAVQDANWQKLTGQGFIRGGANLIYNGAVAAPIKLVRTYNGIKPSYYIDVHAENSYKELDAALAENRNIPRDVRERWVSDYITASPNDRNLKLVQIENDIASDVIKRYNAKNPSKPLDMAMGRELYSEVARLRRNAQAESSSRRTYGSATTTDPTTGLPVRTAAVDSDGARLVPTPLFESQMANHHVLMDFDLFEKAIMANGSNWGKMRAKFGTGWARTQKVTDELTTYWKFAQLFRIGYAPRALADDFLGQVARFGGAAMLFRTASGTADGVKDMFNATVRRSRTAQLKTDLAVKQTQLDQMSAMQANLKSQILRGKAKGQDVTQLEDDMTTLLDDMASVRNEHANISAIAASGAGKKDVRIGREVFSPFFGGQQGELFADLSSGGRNMFNLMGTQTDWYLKEVRRRDWEHIDPVTHGAEKHLQAWNRVISRQIAQSEIGKLAMAGKDETWLANWMRSTPEGRRYAHDVKPSARSVDEQARLVKAEVDHVMNPALPGMDKIREAAVRGEDITQLLKETPLANRPMVNGETWRYAEGTSPVASLMNTSINAFYKFANQLPAQKLLRHPLFGQSYKAHLADQLQILRAQGVTHLDDTMRRTMEQNARKGALDDVKKYTFTLDSETKMSYMLRNFGAFFGAQQESWNRWARIISDKPQVLPHVAQVYGAPARAGLVVDQDGNPVDGVGYSTDPLTGERKLTSYTDRKMLIQVPEYLGGKKLNKALGLDEDASFVIPMSSLELVLNNGDGALPVGAGPYVQIAANHFAKDDPGFADWAKKMGVLPFGPQDSWTNFVNPTTGQRLSQANDDMGQTKQRALFYMMQVENYKYEEGLRDTEPTWDELKDRADRWTIFRTAAAFGLPFSVNGQDPYQFFRDEFQRLQKLDPNSADEKFYDKYGDSLYLFSQSMSKNNSGLRPTAESVKMSKHYQDLIGKLGPEWAGAVVGSEGDGVYSDGAFYYQKSHSTDPASNTPDRVNMSAREAFDQAKIDRGWKQYNSVMDMVNADLFDRGLASYNDSGAEDLDAMRRAAITVLTSPTLNGEENKWYNEAWTREFNKMDKAKYDINAQKWSAIVSDPEIWAKAALPDGTVGQRSDVYSMKTYLVYRAQMQAELARRDSEGGSADITAQSNNDLKTSWDDMVMSLMEQDTKFSWVHSRYFATDMGFNLDQQADEEEQNTLLNGTASIIGQQAAPQQAGIGMMDSLEAGGLSG
ncbi:hypothetical protein SEA_FABIAN_9 [Streptomyces phage Fabian]|uniref:Uncharacterized protein n=1 Tax=Streptomyces phage Fabian TaxID=2652424 RepID=A0A5P8D6W1_9CAUD|nr:hypothetical protein SEA_FABIAN_9 [Streptomyces phage Fabian]